MTTVALRKESVDRNTAVKAAAAENPVSLSARRAWIEIFELQHHNITKPVALRKESVDRNFPMTGPAQKTPESLSARRAWIEM